MRRLTLLVCSLLFALQLSASTISSYPISTVILDPGHGGYDPGAVSNDRDPILEKDLTLELAFRIGDELEHESDINVLYTRIDDSFVSLEDRLALANSVFPGMDQRALFVSLHFNASTAEEASGFEVLVKNELKAVPFLLSDSPDWRISYFATASLKTFQQELNLDNLELARSLMNSFSDMFPSRKDRGIKEQDIYVLNGSIWPAALVESGFLTNEEECAIISDPSWIERAAEAIAEGILTYINE